MLLAGKAMTTRARFQLAVLGLVLAIAAATSAESAPPVERGQAGDRAGVLRSGSLAREVRARATREYWTARRMRSAVPAELSLDADGKISRTPAGVVGRRQVAAVAQRAAAADLSAENASFPNRIHGKAFLTLADGSAPGNYVCSATIVSSNSRALAWTAGHCVNGADLGGGFATRWLFVPGYRNGERLFGVWPAKQLFTTQGWGENQSTRLDIGAALLARDDQGRGIEDVLGARPIEFGRERTGNVDAFGYPVEPNPGALRFDFDGERLYSCASALGSDDVIGPPPGAGPVPLAIDCDMSGGSSGGGWVNGRGAVNGLTSYGYQSDFNHLYGPYFGTIAEDLFSESAGPPLRCASKQVTNLGSGGPQDFTGTVARDVFRVLGGDDRIGGAEGNDLACGGGGKDRLAGAAGNDKLRGGSGNDLILGGPGRDVCDGGPGRDRARGCERRVRIP